jgi:hypothetical protein
VRSIAVTVAVALSAAGAALAGGFAVQAAVLPHAARGDRVAADAAAWLLRYRVTAASLAVVGSQRASSYCLHTWLPRPDGRLARSTLLLLASGVRIVQNDGPIRVDGSRAPEPAHLPMLQFELAGCSAVLGTRAATAAVAGGVRVTRAFASGRPALALHLPTLRHPSGRYGIVRDRVTLYVDPRTYRPVAVAASLGRLRGISRIRLTRATPGLLRRLESSLSLPVEEPR